MKNDISRLDGCLNALLRRVLAVAAVAAAASDVSLIYKKYSGVLESFIGLSNCCSLQRQFTMIKCALMPSLLSGGDGRVVQTHKPIYLFNEVNTMPL